MDAAVPIDDPVKGDGADDGHGAEQETRVVTTAEPTLIVTGASGIAVPVQEMTGNELRDLTNGDGIDRLANAVEDETE